MVSLDELFGIASDEKFRFMLIFEDGDGQVFDAIGFDVLQPAIISLANQYLDLAQKINQKVTIKFYSVEKKEEIPITKIPIYIPQTHGEQSTRHGAYL